MAAMGHNDSIHSDQSEYTEMKKLALIFAFLAPLAFTEAIAQTSCPVYLAPGAASYTGAVANAPSTVYVDCRTTGTPSCTLPAVLDPVTKQCVTPIGYCDESQASTALGGNTFKRQCYGSMTLYPSGKGYSGPLTELGPLFGNKSFPNYLYSGQSPQFQIDTGHYVSLAFTPTAPGLIKFTANNSYGDGGTISLSDKPGGLTAGAPGVICWAAYGGLNSLIVSTAAGNCRVNVGQTYYINFADTNANGEYLCNGGGPPGSCWVAYAFTARPY